ncbi:TetR/AcrR family transcriptional regulator, partial [Methanoregula sp.]|uniref:TetR/AcrR family transcriptional regulator n=1 Tax=Methanoregula sp. TaxID=2052170 RepID=UPI003BAE92AA
MARIVKIEEYNTKRNEILDAALALIYSKGYEQMAIQDILDELKISRGAFYHYFTSKQALLEALIDRTGWESEKILLTIVQD